MSDNPIIDPNRPMPRWFTANVTFTNLYFSRFYDKNAPDAFFHYTSPDALISIVSNNEFWLSDATYLNDRSEVRYGEACALARLQVAIGKAPDEKTGEMLRIAANLFQEKTPPDVYVACFSWEGDDLGQWRAYGEGGVAIEIAYVPMMFGYTSEGVYAKVHYDPEDLNWIFDQILDAYSTAFSEELKDPRPSIRPNKPMSFEEGRAICAEKLYHDLWRQIVLCKEPTFRAEREVRFVYAAHNFSRGDGQWYPVHPSPKFRANRGRIIPYLTSKMLNFVNLPPRETPPKLPIRSIIIGPREDQAVLERGVRKLLDVYGHSDVSVTRSRSPFRSS